MALASGCARPAALASDSRSGHDGAEIDGAGVWVLAQPPDGAAAGPAQSALLAMPGHAACVLAAGDGCLYAGGGRQAILLSSSCMLLVLT